MKNFFLLLSGLAICLFCSCASDRIVRVEGGMIYHAGGKTTAIPYWDESGWTYFFFVRHAEKAIVDPDPPDPPGPPLSDEGMVRAERLGEIMKDANLDLVFSTKYQGTDVIRTKMTADKVRMHYSNMTGVVSTYPVEGENMEAWLTNLVENNRGRRIFVVGHYDTIPTMIEILMGHGYRVLLPPGPKDYGKFYVVVSRGIGESESLSGVMFY